ncbi:MAG: hypothetical protein HYT93_00795 [Parcubacteria group bacterium]|nr:hypothetical protein [Parcubacteria group bacterium]
MNEKFSLHKNEERNPDPAKKEGIVKYREQLFELAQLLLSKAGQEHIQELLDTDQIYEARTNLLFALDEKFLGGYVEEPIAKEKYKLLGFSKIEATRIRNKSEHES